MPFEDDDPVIASYDVFISPPPTSSTSTTTKGSSELYVLQYPSHRPSTKPYSTSRSQKPTSLRLRPNTGIVELDIPIMTSDNYNLPLGDQFGKAMHESRLAHPTTSHGLSGGFSNNQNSINNPINLTDIPQHGAIDTTLHTQTLGGKISTNTDKDPIYMLATLKRNTHEIHLQHLDAVVQLRPQLHHIDAAEEIKKRIETATSRAKSAAAAATGTSGTVDPTAPVKLETKAIELKLKDTSKDDPKDRHQNENARLLRDIQNDPWVRYDWIEMQGDKNTIQTFGVTSSADTDMNINTSTSTHRPRLKATLDNDEWLNKMSSPGIELRTRLKGRDRERARRKRQERARAARSGGEAAGAASTNVTQEVSGEISGTASESSGASEDEDGNVPVDDDGDVEFSVSAGEPSTLRLGADRRPDTGDGGEEEAKSPEVQIKQEAAAPAPSSIPASGGAVTSTTTATKRRGRPPKNKAS